jgi:hypothetical protein
MVDVCHHTQFYLLRWSLANFLPRIALKLNSPNFCFLVNWDYRCEPLHLAPSILIFH